MKNNIRLLQRDKLILVTIGVMTFFMAAVFFVFNDERGAVSTKIVNNKLKPSDADVLTDESMLEADIMGRGALDVDDPFGFFHFQKDDSIALPNGYVRTSLSWGEIEPKQPESGKASVYKWEGPQVSQTVNYLLEGRNVIPSVRAISPWATKTVDQGKCASAPKDIRSMESKKGYSDSYYDFITALITNTKFKDKFDIIVIENEMHDPDFWCPGSTMDDYMKVLKTAKKAVNDAYADKKISKKIKLSDGGVQGSVLIWLAIEDAVKDEKIERAKNLYKHYKSEDIDEKQLMKVLSKSLEKTPVKNARELINPKHPEKGLYAQVDVVNFHHYQSPATLVYVAKYLQDMSGKNKPIMTNELGAKIDEMSKDELAYDNAARYLTKKYARLLQFNIKPIVWFSVAGEDGNHTGSFIDKNGNIKPETLAAYNTARKFLRGKILSIKNKSTATLVRISYKFTDKTVDVAWSRSNGKESVALDKDCRAYMYSGESIGELTLTVTAKPVFIECADKK